MNSGQVIYYKRCVAGLNSCGRIGAGGSSCYFYFCYVFSQLYTTSSNYPERELFRAKDLTWSLVEGFLGMIASLTRHLLNYYMSYSLSLNTLAILMKVSMAAVGGLFFYFQSVRRHLTYQKSYVFYRILIKFWQLRLNWVAVKVISILN